MKRFQTLSIPLVAALSASMALPAAAQISFEISSDKSYRQSRGGGMSFGGGTFRTLISDGSVKSNGVCNDSNYYPPTSFTGLCGSGTSAFLVSGNINGATVQRPYLVITSLNGAIAIQGEFPENVQLVSGPASALPRPSGGFIDTSATVFYNLHTTNIREYTVANYSLRRTYTSDQRDKFDSEIVPGVYFYSLPRLGAPNLKIPLSAVIYPMPEGLKTINNQKRGVEFTQVNQNRWNSDGYIELSYHRPNEIRWNGPTSGEAFLGADQLYFSMRILQNPKDPQKSVLVEGETIYPPYLTENVDADGNSITPRVQLATPFVTSFTMPPIFPSGTRGMIQLEVQRTFQTSGITFDRSNRKFQIPAIVVDRYTDRNFNADILADSDSDKFNNLTEWILDSDANDPFIVPLPPLPAPFQGESIVGNPLRFGSYFGFNVNVKRETIPQVKYILQRSRDQGRTWSRFRSDRNWSVRRVTTTTFGATKTQIQVRSNIPNRDPISNTPFIQPPGTSGHLYRVKIVLQK